MANPTASEIMGYIQSKGYSRSAAAAMVGNISVETPKFNPAKSHDDGMGIGLFGHQKDRRHSRNPQIGLRAFARARGKTERDWKTQIDFAIHEIETKPAYAQTHRALTNPNLTEAQKASVFSVNFERPGTPHLARRMSNATRYMRAAPAQSYTQTPKTGPVPIFAARQTIDDMPVSLRTAAAMPTARPPTMIAEVPAAVQPEYSIPRKTSYFTSTPAEIAARPPSKTFDNHINVDAPPINASLTGSALGGSTAIQGIDVNSIPGLFSGSPKDEIDALRNYADGIQTNPSLDAGRFDRANPVNSIDNMAGALEDAALSPNGTPIGPWATGYTPQSATPAFDGQSLGAPGLLGMPPVGDPAIQQDKDIGQLAALGFFGDPLPEDPLTPTITPPPVRTDPDIYDWGTPATTPTTTTATAPATTLAPLDDDMSYRLGGTPATRPAVNPMTVKDPDPFAGYPISPAKRADTAPAVSSWTGGGVAGPGPASLIDIIKGRTGGAVTGLLDSLLSPTPPTPIDPARQASIAQANITNPTAHAIPGGGVNYSGASANFPGMDIAVTNPFGVTTVMDDNMSFIDNTGKAGGLFGGGLLGGLFSPSAPATEADPNSPGSAGGGIGGADGGGGGGNKVLCTHYHRIGWLDDETYAHDVLYGLQISPEIRAGYHQWAIPLVRALTRHKWLERAVWPPVWLWAHSMANPDKWWSRALRWTGETICKLIAPKRRYAYGAR